MMQGKVVEWRKKGETGHGRVKWGWLIERVRGLGKVIAGISKMCVGSTTPILTRATLHSPVVSLSLK
jgi:hypothetical protein